MSCLSWPREQRNVVLYWAQRLARPGNTVGLLVWGKTAQLHGGPNLIKNCTKASFFLPEDAKQHVILLRETTAVSASHRTSRSGITPGDWWHHVLQSMPCAATTSQWQWGWGAHARHSVPERWRADWGGWMAYVHTQTHTKWDPCSTPQQN